MIDYFIGFSTIDNYTYFLYFQISYNYNTISNILINGTKAIIKELHQKNKKIFINIYYDHFDYIGVINDDNFSGNATILHDQKKLSSGKFITTKVNTIQFNNMLNYNSPWLWLTNSIKHFKPKIHPLLSKPHRFINVLTFNICSSFVWTGISGIKKVANIINNNFVDVVFLQEIGQTEFDKLVEVLNSKKNKYYSDYSTGIITKFKISKVYNRNFYSPIYGAKLKIDNKTLIRAFNSHLDNIHYNSLDKSHLIQLPHLNLGLYSIVYNKKNDPVLATLLCGDHNIISHLDDDKPWPISTKLYNDGWIDSYREVNKTIDNNIDATYPNCNVNDNIIYNEIGSICTGKNKYRHRIDYIYSKNGKNTSLVPFESFVIDKYNKYFPSDHSAVFTKFLILH